MAIRESVLAIYGEISNCLERLDRVADTETRAQLRALTLELTGLTGSAGERGWLGELFHFFDDHRNDGDRAERSDPVQPPTLVHTYEELGSSELVLAPSWASRTLAAAHVLDQFNKAGITLPSPPEPPPPKAPESEAPEPETPESEPPESPGPPEPPPILLLELAFAASPGFPNGIVEGPPVRLGREAGADLARQLSGHGFGGATDYWAALAALPNLHSSVATLKLKQRLRKVKGEYCGVVSTSADWNELSYTKLKRVIAPENWSKFFEEFFCGMEVLDIADDYGWTRILESVSGDCKRYELRTGLRFWKSDHKGGLFINYDMDPNQDPRADPLVLVDNGYIWITPLKPDDPASGVRVLTSKELLISGMSATAMVKLAETMGVATNACDMFVQAEAYTGTDVNPWTPSVEGEDPDPDTSTSWKTVVPRLPDSLRDEMCRDATEFLQKRLESANQFGCEFGAYWEDGVDGDELDQLMEDIGEEVTESAKLAFQLASENFRPQPQPPAPAEP